MNQHTTKTGKQFDIRRPNENDAENIINYAKTLFASTDQVLTTPDEFTMTTEQEKVWINNSLQNPNAIILIAELNKQVIGLLDFSAKLKKKFSHTGELGISVHPDFQGIGIGRSLLKTFLEWAKENKQIEKVILNVFVTNQRAINLYKDSGFTEECRQIKAIKQPNGKYVDLLQMYLETK